MARFWRLLAALGAAWATACVSSDGTEGLGGDGAVGVDSSAAGAAGDVSAGGSSAFDASIDLGSPDARFDPDAACAKATEQAQIEFLPVDIIWIVDNSVSMKPAVDEVTAGLNDFAQLIGQKSLDYKVIMLSLRSKTNPVQVNGKDRYGVCIPPPLAGDGSCGNGPRFFQSSIDVKSTQPLEQFIGTLGQTFGYRPTDYRGGEPWKDELRPEATKTVVSVTDDNSRFTADQFEHFVGGSNPWNSSELPPGILDPSWGGIFDGYVFDAIYGWGSDSDPTVTCTYPGGATPPAPGTTYTDLVTRTGGVRAKICDGAAAWGPFFDEVAKAVATTSKISCELAIPEPSEGMLEPTRVNVSVTSDGGTETLFKVKGAADCDAGGGWYYDDDASPTRVILCPASCADAEQKAKATSGVSVSVHFGCTTLVK